MDLLPAIAEMFRFVQVFTLFFLQASTSHNISIKISKFSQQSCPEKEAWLHNLLTFQLTDEDTGLIPHVLTCVGCVKSKVECQLRPEYPSTKKYICDEVQYLARAHPNDILEVNR